jgi:hypothetical protein
VTTTDAAAARRQHVLVALAFVIGLAGFGLAGCGGGSLFESANNTTPDASPAPRAETQPTVAKVAINTIVGPPDPLAKQLQQEFTSALNNQRVAVTASREERADFSLRPYILAAKEKNSTKISYVLDVTDPAGKRVNRFAGEEVVGGNASQDPWSAITPAVAQSITAKATGAFVAWLPSAQSAAVATNATQPAGAGANAPKSAQVSEQPPARAPRPAAAPKQTVAAAPAAAPPASKQTTGSIDRDGGVSATVPTVTGAPGDGTTALTAAIKRELAGKGVTVAERTASAYRVEGAVTMGEPREGKQAIQIEWVVKDPQGKRLGTVSQKNDIPEGSLDGAWGRTADQAAGAAVQGIVKLLPQGSGKAVN